ncbi:MAG: methyltransferase [Clostridiales bacterium]|nr:methyltransferase [Clostridiales bacterium]
MTIERQLQELLDNKNVRNNLSQLKQVAKDEAGRREIIEFAKGHIGVLESFLADEDPKTRKNAALLIGQIRLNPAAEALYEAYSNEQTLFVRSSYLQALSDMNYGGHNQQFHERLDELLTDAGSEETRKHSEEEIRALRSILMAQEGIERHILDVADKKVTVLLLTNHEHREFIRSKVPVGRTAIHPLGVLVETDELRTLMKFRLHREMVFPIALRKNLAAAGEACGNDAKGEACTGAAGVGSRAEGTARETGADSRTGTKKSNSLVSRTLSPQPREAARQLAESNLYKLLSYLHREAGTFYYRLDLQRDMPTEDKGVFLRTLSAELEKCSEGRLVNSPSNYEVEIRLIPVREGRYFPCMRLAAVPDRRFSYRKNVVAASIHPSDAALMMELAAAYLKEDAQILDPFCGVGTMLIERNYRVHARDMYGTDIFTEAIEKGRENADKAKMKINFVNRDFFGFKHEYPFDEIVSNMPARGKKTKDEQDRLYGDFFSRVQELLHDGSRLILYSNEMGFIKKQLRLHGEFKLRQETLIRKEGGYYLYVIEYKG